MHQSSKPSGRPMLLIARICVRPSTGKLRRSTGCHTIIVKLSMLSIKKYSLTIHSLYPLTICCEVDCLREEALHMKSRYEELTQEYHLLEEQNAKIRAEHIEIRDELERRNKALVTRLEDERTEHATSMRALESHYKTRLSGLQAVFTQYSLSIHSVFGCRRRTRSCRTASHR